MDTLKEIQKITDSFFTVTGKEKNVSELDSQLLDLFKKKMLEIVGEDSVGMPTHDVVTKAMNDQKKIIRGRIEANCK